MTVQDVIDSYGWSLLHYAAWLVIVSMQYATLYNAQHIGPFKLCAGLSSSNLVWRSHTHSR